MIITWFCVIGVNLSKPHINGTSMRELYMVDDDVVVRSYVCTLHIIIQWPHVNFYPANSA